MLFESISAIARIEKLKILLPRIFPIPISLLPIITAETVTTSSGNEVAHARKTAPAVPELSPVRVLILSTIPAR